MGYLWGSRREQVYGFWNAEMTGQSIFGVEFSTKSDMYTNGDNLYVWLSTGASRIYIFLFQISPITQINNFIEHDSCLVNVDPYVLIFKPTSFRQIVAQRFK